MEKKSTRSSAQAEPSAAVHAAEGNALLSLEADGSSVASTSTSASLVGASARGESPRGSDPSLEVDYECESDEMADSRTLEKSPEVVQATYNEPSSGRARSDSQAENIHYSMFGSDDDSSSPIESPIASNTLLPVRGNDDGASHRKDSISSTHTSVGTSQG